ncbi:Alpha/Beta hydrolase protein [Ilyonectria robusta]|uniref:Alpha/Beta hydrolase protein n=1 Tax=Ilyonectria robusta TaxID=1079257 RepID=UPI001E8EB5D1|nr:Alpha/Beta hydrolase protein [Ilyonectria robusta]KAH8663344.1 Alpha/Beta hydrolase protein [Ilyonectria robusta]
MVRPWYCVLASTASAFGYGTFRLQDAPQSVCASEDSGKVGYFDFADNSKHLFFWLAESRDSPSTDPVILWMNGGPGASSVAFGLFGELGPCLIDGPNATKRNPYAWNNHANLIFVDQPVNVGFSYSDDPVKNLDDAMTDMYAFLTNFMEEFPQYARQDFYIMGESYAGSWVPALARRIHQRQSSPMTRLISSTSNVSEARINLKGIGLGNAQLSQNLQWSGFYPTGCLGDSPIFNKTTCAIIESHMPQCENMLRVCAELKENKDVCGKVLDYCRDKSVAFIHAEHLNPYDFRQRCENGGLCYDIAEWVEQYLNSSITMQKLGVPEDVKFNIVDAELFQNFVDSGDMEADSITWAEELLDQNYRVLVYVGNKDWYCNAAGEKNLVHNMRWKHQPAFQARDFQPFTMDKREIGTFKQAEGLSFVEVYDAGHMVPSDKPEEALFLIESWIHDRLRST